MGLGKIFLFAGAALVLLLSAARAFPAKLLGKAAVNALIGLGAMLLLNAITPLTSLHLGVNVFNLLVVGVLGAPGLGLLLLVNWIV